MRIKINMLLERVNILRDYRCEKFSIKLKYKLVKLMLKIGREKNSCLSQIFGLDFDWHIMEAEMTKKVQKAHWEFKKVDLNGGEKKGKIGMSGYGQMTWKGIWPTAAGYLITQINMRQKAVNTTNTIFFSFHFWICSFISIFVMPTQCIHPSHWALFRAH